MLDLADSNPIPIAKVWPLVVVEQGLCLVFSDFTPWPLQRCAASLPVLPISTLCSFAGMLTLTRDADSDDSA